MAPSFDYDTSTIQIYEGTAIYSTGCYSYAEVKKETKKQRIARIAKEKMHASWKTFNEKPRNVINVKQLRPVSHRKNIYRNI